MAETSSNRTYFTPRRIIALVVVAVFLVFIAQNRTTASIQFLLVEVSGPLWLTLLVTFVLGGAVTWLLLDRRRRS